MRWKARFFLKGDKSPNETTLSDFLPPKHHLKMKPFEDDVLNNMKLLAHSLAAFICIFRMSVNIFS